MRIEVPFFDTFWGKDMSRVLRNLFGAFIAMATALPSAGCDPMKPSGGKAKTVGGVSLTLKSEDMALLSERENPTKVRIRVFAVVDGQRGDQEGNDAVFNLEQNSATYKVSKVKLGMKEFEVHILDGNNDKVGEGKRQHLVKPGLTTMDPIEIQIVAPDRRRRALDMSLRVTVEVPGETPKVTYMDVKQTINNNCVAGCHTDTAPDGGPYEPKGGLVLKDFPFKSILHPEWSQDDIVSDMVFWMKDLTDPMPPPTSGGRLPDAKIDQIEQWRLDGLLKYPSSDQSADLAKKIKVKWKLKDSEEAGELMIERSANAEHPFRTSAPNFAIGGTYELAFEVYAIDNTLTYSTMADYVLPEGGMFEKVLTIPYEEPAVDIPVVVTR